MRAFLSVQDADWCNSTASDEAAICSLAQPLGYQAPEHRRKVHPFDRCQRHLRVTIEPEKLPGNLLLCLVRQLPLPENAHPCRHAEHRVDRPGGNTGPQCATLLKDVRLPRGYADFQTGWVFRPAPQRCCVLCAVLIPFQTGWVFRPTVP